MCSTPEQDSSLAVGGAWTHHPSVPPGFGPIVLPADPGSSWPGGDRPGSGRQPAIGQPAGATEAAGAPEARGEGAGAGDGDTTRSSERTIKPGSARLWLVRTEMVSPSIGKWRTAPRKPRSRPEWPRLGCPSIDSAWTPNP